MRLAGVEPATDRNLEFPALPIGAIDASDNDLFAFLWLRLRFVRSLEIGITGYAVPVKRRIFGRQLAAAFNTALTFDRVGLAEIVGKIATPQKLDVRRFFGVQNWSWSHRRRRLFCGRWLWAWLWVRLRL